MRHLVFALLAAGLVGCASSGSSGPSPSSVRTSNPDYITSIEVEATPATNAYDLIRRLRPRWIQSTKAGSLAGNVRRQVVAVVLDGTRLGGLETLQSISSSGIKTLQYYDAIRAATVLRDAGSDPIAGAIVITTTKIQ